MLYEVAYWEALPQMQKQRKTKLGKEKEIQPKSFPVITPLLVFTPCTLKQQTSKKS